MILALKRRCLRIVLRQRPDAIERAARHFAMREPDDRARLARLGSAFLSGYHTVLDADRVDAAFDGLPGVAVHERPFWAEGAAMGLVARGGFDPACAPRALGPLLARHIPGFLYLGYVGLGFWFGFRHPRAPSRIDREIAPGLDPLYVPLCYDGWGFKLGFFDWPSRPAVLARLARTPPQHRRAAWQGFGRALFFALRDDERRFVALAGDDPERADDLESGRSLALAFTRADRPDAIARHLDAARGDRELAARLLGTAWALTARYRGDPAYFERCLSAAPVDWRGPLEALPELTLTAERAATSYLDWRERTAVAALALIKR